MMAGGHRETTALELIVIYVAEIRPDVDDLWQTVQPGPSVTIRFNSDQ